MKILLSWVNEFLSTPLSAAEVEESLISNGIEVALTASLAQGLEKVVVAKVVEFAKHPDADRLRVCKVTDGSDTFAIVCGAKNFEAGDHVALAMVGAKLPNGMEIKKSKIRGVQSFGMLCSEEELGLKDEAEGILILSRDTTLGQPLADVLDRNDTLIELELTPNRGDCLSIVGVAQEVAAHRAISAKIPSTGSKGGVKGDLRIQIEDPKDCPRYSLQLFDSIATGPSIKPLTRLGAIGLRNRLNAIDITNYVMWERGQPLHVFDADHVVGSISVRRAKAGESILCLDDEERALTTEDLIIADEKGPIAIAGVIGGKRASVTEATQKILLESAHFSPTRVRKTSKRLNVHTDSSHRFERFVDPAGVWSASTRARELLENFCQARHLAEADAGTTQFDPVKIRLRKASVLRHLGQEVKNEGEYLARLGFSVERKEDDFFVEVPTRRPDITREIDLIEEIARLHGYSNFGSKLPSQTGIAPLWDSHVATDTVKSFLAQHGCFETCSYSFASSEHNALFSTAGESPVKILNGLTQDMQEMRVSLFPHLIEAWKRNQVRQVPLFRAFEWAKTYRSAPESTTETPAIETRTLGLLFAGQMPKAWDRPERPIDFYDLKGLIEAFSEEFNLNFSFVKAEVPPPYLHPGICAEIRFRGKTCGVIGALHPNLATRLEVEAPILAELKVDPWIEAIGNRSKFKPFSIYPFSEKDLAFVVDSTRTSFEITDLISSLKLPHLASVRLFDVYTGKGIPKGKKSLAYTLRFSSQEKTLTDEEISGDLRRVIDAVATRLDGQLRS